MIYHSISKKELPALMQEPDTLVIDVREAAEHALGNLGGINVPLSEFGARMHELPRGKHIVLYCRSGGRSEFAAKALLDAGFEHVTNVRGGIIGA